MNTEIKEINLQLDEIDLSVVDKTADIYNVYYQKELITCFTCYDDLVDYVNEHEQTEQDKEAWFFIKLRNSKKYREYVFTHIKNNYFMEMHCLLKNKPEEEQKQ